MLNMSANSDQSSTISMPVADLGNESFCGCYVASLTDTRAKKVVSVDSTTWIYLPIQPKHCAPSLLSRLAHTT